MLLATLLSAALCSPPALPADPAARTEAFWVSFLNTVLHDCYGDWNPLIQDTPASVDPFAKMAGSMFTFQIEGTKTDVIVEPAFLAWAPTADHVAATLGHEAVHIGIFAKLGINAMPDDQEEVMADMMAATSVRHGACRLVETYEWHLARLLPKENQPLAVRTAILKPLCTTQLALE